MSPKKLIASFTFLLINFISFQLISVQYENQIIERIDVEMMNLSANAPFDSKGIKARIKSKEGDRFSQIIFDNDLKTLAKDYDRIDPILECIEGKVYITLKIWPKPTIRTLVWRGNERINTKDLENELGIASGAVFDRQEFNTAFHKLKAYYISKGFFEAQLEYIVTPDSLSNQVDIEIIVREGRAGRINDIVFINFTPEERDCLLEMIVTKTYNFFLSWLTEEGTYREEAIQQDEYTILNFLQNRGYADAKVKIDVRETSCDRITLYITANKGEVYRFGHITLNGITLFPIEDVQKRIIIKEGMRYSPEKLNQTITNISDFYGKYGYIDAAVNYEPRLVTDQYIYDIDLRVEEGDQYRVGLIKVFGNSSTQSSVILHETLLIPGEIFNIEKLKLSEERLKNIGYFNSVNVYAVKSEASCGGLGGNFRDVHIEVEEKGTGHFGTFIGYSTVESLFGGFSITETNFNYKGIRRALYGKGMSLMRGGGEYLSFNTTIGTKTRSYVLSWNKPYFMDTKWIVGFDLEQASTRYVSKDYDINASGFELHAVYPLNQFMRIRPHYRFKYTDISVDSEAPRRLRREARNSGAISAIGLTFTYDSTNHPLFPTKGFKSVAEGEYAGIGGKHHFLGLAYLNSYYFKIKEFDTKGVWKVRCDTRFLYPLGRSTASSIPIDERLFLGGDNTLRGFRPYKPGPKYKRGDPRGGISMQILSLEYSRPLWKDKVVGLAFVDAGSLTFKKFAFGRFYTSIGWGFRISVFESIPPVVLGMGYPLNPKRRGDVKKFFIAVGGRF